MSKQLLVLEEVLAMLAVVGTPTKFIDAFEKQAKFVAGHQNKREADEVSVASGFGHKSQRGHVELTVNDRLLQMDVKKAKEVGLMLLEAAEAATSDEIMIRLLERVGLPAEARGQMLLHLREIRQGTRKTSYPS